MEDRAEIVSRSLADARREIPELDDDAGVVSIGSPTTQPPSAVDPERPRHVRLEFDDVQSEESLYAGRQVHPPQRDHIEELVDHSDALLQAELVYCHCAAGISRSTAAAFILDCRQRGPGEEFESLEEIVRSNPFASPNRRMVQFADDILGRDGAMMTALEEISGRIER